MLFDPKIKPRLWNLKSGTVAYNCARMGLPVPVLAMPMWEGSGNLIRDYSEQNRHGANNGAAWSTSDRGACLNLDSTTDYISLGTFDPSATDLTILLWVYYRGEDGQDVMVAKRDSWATNNMRWQLTRHNANEIRLEQPNSKAQFGVDFPATNTWIFVSLVHVSGGMDTLYFDGVSVSSVSAMTFGTDTTAACVIGNSSLGNSEGFNGLIDNVNIFNVAFTANQIRIFYNNSYGMFEPIRSPAIWSFAGDGGISTPVMMHHYNQLRLG